GPAPLTAPSQPQPPKSQRGRWIALCSVLAGIVVVALLVTYFVSKDKTTQMGSPSPSRPVTVTPDDTSTPPATSSSSTPPPSTSESKPPSQHDEKLYAALPAVYKQNTCEDAATPAGAAAAVECGDANVGDVKSGNVVFPQPTGAKFLRFADAAAMDAYFQNIVTTQGLDRNDAQGACRPLKYPKIWGTYYRAETRNPVPGDYLTCFPGEPAQLVWTDAKTLTVGILLSTKVTNNDQLDQLYYWWNEEILVDMPGGS
ncbi:MAG: serine/threonine kinase PknH, partial [Actinomycetota bacterium]|nr:serine/threonine kinase PknH [Actinomycetota bacterium]